MPTLTRYFIKAGLIYFVVALSLAVALSARPYLRLPDMVVAFTPVYIHLLMVGWVTQLILGVVYWMFPKYSKEHPRGSERLGWLAFVLLNAGLILRALGEPLAVNTPGAAGSWMLALSALFQLIAGWAVVINTWGRVKER